MDKLEISFSAIIWFSLFLNWLGVACMAQHLGIYLSKFVTTQRRLLLLVVFEVAILAHALTEMVPIGMWAICDLALLCVEYLLLLVGFFLETIIFCQYLILCLMDNLSLILTHLVILQLNGVRILFKIKFKAYSRRVDMCKTHRWNQAPLDDILRCLNKLFVDSRDMLSDRSKCMEEGLVWGELGRGYHLFI